VFCICVVYKIVFERGIVKNTRGKSPPLAPHIHTFDAILWHLIFPNYWFEVGLDDS